MKHIIIKTGAFITAALAFASCSFLDINPVDSYDENVVFGNTETANAYVTKRYSEIWDPLSRYALRFACDESMNNFNWGGQNGLQWGQMGPDYDAGLGTWWQYYGSIQSCNVFLDKIPELELLKTDESSTRLIEQYIAEVRFIRAFFYADLISRYGGVILSKKAFRIDMSNDELLLPRSTYEECVRFIVEEIDEAKEYLPVRYDANWLGRATKGAALALKARVLLYAASPLHDNYGDKFLDYNVPTALADAKAAIEDIIFLNEDGTSSKDSGTKVYALDNDYYSLFRNITSKEIIFEKLFSSDHGHIFDQYNSPNGFTGWSETCVNRGLVDAYEIAATGELPNDTELYGGNDGKEYEIGTTPWDGRDPRFYASIGYDGSIWKGREIEYYLIRENGKDIGGGRDSNKGGIEEWNASKTGFYCKKYMTETLPVSYNDLSTVPWIYFRLGEMYLNYAEICYRTGDEATAREYVNKIRERARGGNSSILPDITSTGDRLWQDIMHERRIELAFEEHRFFDVRRWMTAPTDASSGIHGVIIYKDSKTGKKTYKRNTATTTTFKEANYVFAIPTSERQKNSKLEQNPKYN